MRGILPAVVLFVPLLAAPAGGQTVIDEWASVQAPAAPAPEGRSPALGRPGGGREDGTTLKLWAQDHEGWLTMDAVATLRGA